MMNRLHLLSAAGTLSFASFVNGATHPSPTSPNDSSQIVSISADGTPSAPPDSVPVAVTTPVATAPATTAPPASTQQPLTYTSVKGDSFSSLADRFHTTVRTLKKLNGIKVTHLKPGTVLEIPPSKKPPKLLHAPTQSAIVDANKKPLTPEDAHRLALAEAIAATKKMSHSSPVAQPAQDFDISPSAFASCPPPPTANQSDSELAADEGSYLPSAKAGSAPTEQDPTSLVANNRHASLLPVPNIAPIVPLTPKIAPVEPPPVSVAHQTVPPPVMAPHQAIPGVLAPASSKKSFASAVADFFGGAHGASESGEWGNKFLEQTRTLASYGVGYDHSWRPEGESHNWEMDCSNTSRYLYRVTAGIELPRTASDQYYYLHLQDKAWDVPVTSAGFADCNFLRSNLKPGDLLFWENTYRPERQPPITHVMIFLGTDARGRWLMAGSQGSRGFYNPHHSGPDVYVFDPTHSVGGYTTWMGLVHHKGRFIAYGRPLEADAKKLSVASSQ